MHKVGVACVCAHLTLHFPAPWALLHQRQTRLACPRATMACALPQRRRAVHPSCHQPLYADHPRHHPGSAARWMTARLSTFMRAFESRPMLGKLLHTVRNNSALQNRFDQQANRATHLYSMLSVTACRSGALWMYGPCMVRSAEGDERCTRLHARGWTMQGGSSTSCGHLKLRGASRCHLLVAKSQAKLLPTQGVGSPLSLCTQVFQESCELTCMNYTVQSLKDPLV